MELEILKTIIEKTLGKTMGTITEKTTFVDDLGIDSLDFFQILIDLEETYDIHIDQQEAEEIVTIGDAVETLRRATKEKEMENNLKKLEQTIGYQFTAKSLLEQAMTHSSYANEKHLGKIGCNERLEFLGDAVLELISSDFLYKKFRNNQEGELTKKRASMVCEKSLAYCAREFGLPEFILLGRGEEMMGGRKRDSIVSDALESLIGAMYLDGGFEPAQTFVLKFILNDLEDKRIFFDSKTVLQEMVQEGGNHPVEYRLLKEEGPDHSKSFTVEALINGESMGTGTGHTKKAAEQAAALEAIRRIK